MLVHLPFQAGLPRKEKLDVRNQGFLADIVFSSYEKKT